MELDAIVVSAGFGGTYQLHRLRQEGFTAKLLESGSSYGGVWYWNQYPGARVDSTTPHYEFSDPALWNDWKWKQRFPGSAELRDYFKHVADKWDLRKDTLFNTTVTKSVWLEKEKRWVVTCLEGESFKVRFLLLNIRFAAKRHIPDWVGLENFKGTWVHPSYWPKEEPDLEGKRVAIIGTGSTGVQIAQEMAKKASHLTVFQRTPCLALPMKQEEYKPGGRQAIEHSDYQELFDGRYQSYGGFNFNFLPRATFEDTPERRKAVYEELWQKGDFHFWLATYQDMLFSKGANAEAYKFWLEKTQHRRVALENGFYEIFNQDNVELVDVNETPVECVTEKDIKTSEKEHEFDYVICATGFDAITGGLKSIDIQGTDGQTLKEKWAHGTSTYLGMSVSGFPNMFVTYGPQAPTALCNGPTCAELQGEWIIGAMKHLDTEGKQAIEAQQ
ncbi:FAD/NAD(P)-binding domain-containing protein [Cadophora sp. DSE1049]|nr:FAD/NAD(P)-binding domain-containing protein [Cadophora sp. DSE1049]